MVDRAVDTLISPVRLYESDDYETTRDPSRLHKFGENSDIDAGETEDLWDGGGNANANGVYDYPSAAVVLGLSSDDNGDTEDVVVQGLDADWAPQSETVTLTGQTKAETTGSYIRVFRVYNAGAAALAGDVYVYDTSDSVVAGVPQTPAKIHAIVTAEYQQTMMAMYSVPVGHTLVVTACYASLSRLATAAVGDIALVKREFGGVFRAQEEWSIHTYSGVKIQHFNPPRIIAAKTDIKLRAYAVSNNTHVHGGFHSYVVPGAWV